MWTLTQAAWIVAALIGTWGMAGFMPHLLRPERRAAWWFALAVVLLLTKAGARSLWWDGLPLVLGAARAREVQIAAGGLQVNIVFNLLAIAAAFAVLKLLHLLIPEEDRHLYSPWTAPIYPARVGIGPFVEYLRDVWRSRRR